MARAGRQSGHGRRVQVAGGRLKHRLGPRGMYQSAQ
jgi:hypothetical protein